jgi:hypothetical protein
MKLTLGILACLLALNGCDSKKKGQPENRGQGNSGTSTGFTLVILKDSSATAQTLLSAAPNQPQSCHIGLTQTAQASGSCLNPSSIELWASGVALGSQKPQDCADPTARECGPARILGGGSGFARDGRIEGAKIELSDADSIRGTDNLFHKYTTRPTFDLASIEAAYIRAAFDLQGSTWEMLVPFYDQPVEETDILKACYDPPYLEQAKTNANLLPGIQFKAGDFLFCKRSTSTSACDLNDFQWFDSASKTLVSTRPAAPKRLTSLGSLNRKCNRPAQGDAPPDASYQMPAFRADLKNPIQIYGDLSHGADSKSNPGGDRPVGVNQDEWNQRITSSLKADPYNLYFVTNGGATQSGNKLSLNITIDSTNWLFLEGVTDIAGTAIETVLASLTTKEFFAWEKIGFEKIGGVEGGWKAEIEATTSNATLSEIYAQ